MQTRRQRVGLIAQNTRMPNIFDYISFETCTWAQKDCTELLDGSSCPLQLCQVSSVLMLPPFSAFFVRRENIILVCEAILKNLCMDL